MPHEEQMREKRVQEILRKQGVEGILFFTAENIRYLTGFSGSEGYLLAREDDCLFMVDSRYILQAQEETRGCRTALLEKGIKGLPDHISPLGLKKVGFEAQGISVALFAQLQGSLQGVELVPLKEELEQLRGCKASEEIASIKEAIAIAKKAWEKAVAMARPGIGETEVALELEYTMRKKGSEGVAFDPIVASGPRSALPHARPTSRTLKEGDLLLFDFGARHEGYCSDESSTVVLVRATKEQRRIYSIVKAAHDKAIERVKPGIRLSEIDAAARGHIAQAGHASHFGHGTGHGVGLAVHEWPGVTKESPDRAEAGMIFTIEPGIYIPDWGGVRIEDMVLITRDGCEVLTTIPKDLMIIP
jgi:Xaa-Pro aminopeptidase